jgi:hypothetical protein
MLSKSPTTARLWKTSSSDSLLNLNIKTRAINIVAKKQIQKIKLFLDKMLDLMLLIAEFEFQSRRFISRPVINILNFLNIIYGKIFKKNPKIISKNKYPKKRFIVVLKKRKIFEYVPYEDK